MTGHPVPSPCLLGRSVPGQEESTGADGDLTSVTLDVKHPRGEKRLQAQGQRQTHSGSVWLDDPWNCKTCRRSCKVSEMAFHESLAVAAGAGAGTGAVGGEDADVLGQFLTR